MRRQLALANVKPRLRMTSLYYLANRYNGLVVGTGNKTELAIGYFTKYGDGGVDVLPLGDLDKTAVRGLARAARGSGDGDQQSAVGRSLGRSDRRGGDWRQLRPA